MLTGLVGQNAGYPSGHVACSSSTRFLTSLYWIESSLF